MTGVEFAVIFDDGGDFNVDFDQGEPQSIEFDEEIVINGGGGGASSLSDLDDVDLSSPSDGQVLGFDADTGKWTNQNAGGGAVDSVNGQTGTVVLDAGDLGYDENETYSSGTVGDAITDLKSDLSQCNIPHTVRQSIVALFNKAIYAETGAENYIEILENWATVTVESVFVSPSTLTFTGATTQTITATVVPSEAQDSVFWTTSDSSVATVSSSGVVSPVGNGSCTITATAGGISASCSVSVSGITSSHSVTNTLTGCVTSNNNNTVADGGSYSATITPDDGYMLPFVSASVTMGGSDITSTAWSNGTVSIASVTGDIVITVSATQDTKVYVAKWDFTKSLYDSVGGLEMVLSNSTGGSSLPTRDANGLHFTAAEQLAICSAYSGGTTDGRTYEIDISSATFAGDSSKHKRLLLNGDRGLMIYRNNGALQVYSGAWKTYTAEAGKTIPTTTDELSGKTVSVTLQSDKTFRLDIDGETYGTIPTWTAANYGMNSIGFGGISGQNASAGNQIHNMTITGFRIYTEA